MVFPWQPGYPELMTRTAPNKDTDKEPDASGVSGARGVSSANKRAQKSERARLTICEATVQCLAELGYSETSISRVVAKAKVSKGALQHHFPSKEDLMASTASYLLARPVQYSDRDTSSNVRERLRAFWDRMANTRAYLALLEILIAARTDQVLQARIAAGLKTSIKEIDEHFLPGYGDLDEQEQDDVLLLMTANRCLMRGLLVETQYGISEARQRQVLERWFDMLAPELEAKAR
jgi:AcrR family transcriptional regulator